jgi:superfamily II DNA/RNA helicase
MTDSATSTLDIPDALSPEVIDTAVGAPRFQPLKKLLDLVRSEEDVSLRVLLAAPGDGIATPEGVGDPVLDHRFSMQAADRWWEWLVEVFAHDIDHCPRRDENQRTIVNLLELIQSGDVDFRFFDGEALYSRAMILEAAEKRVAVTGAGGFSPSGFRSERELRSIHHDEDADSVSEWFEQLWDESPDVTEQMAEILADSWACRLLSPEQGYHKVLIEYFSEMLDSQGPIADDNPMLDNLAGFQRSAYASARGILRRFGGVFVADVVGLGKTYVGLALLKYATRVQQSAPLIIAPPRLCDMWERLATRHEIEHAVLSNHQLEKLGRYENRDLVLIDEAHAFRNDDTQRYEQMMQFLRPQGQPSTRRMIMLTATPQNNTCWDVYNQLRLFPDNYSPLPYRGEDLKDYFKKVDKGQEDLSSLMQHVLVRRTRGFIEQHYPDATLPQRDEDGNVHEVPVEFPERRDGPDMALRYSIADAYDGLYDDIIETLGSLSYARYGLVDYLRDAKREQDKYENLTRAGRSIRGLFKATTLKRCESSLEAFKSTLSWLLTTNRAFLHALTNQNSVITNPDHVGQKVEDLAMEDVVDLFEGTYPATDFRKTELIEDVSEDIEWLEMLLDDIKQIPVADDAKLERLREHLDEHDPLDHKTIVFTQFTDTADYLYEQLKDEPCTVDRITGNHGNQLKIIERFAPRAAGVEESPDDEIDLLISTDVLAEGVNLQDADTVVNYDLHWNPVRLIQRAGRIDRIGSQNDVIYLYNFLPETALEKELALEDVLQSRVNEIQSVFGADGRVLPDQHNVEASEVVETYTGDALEQNEQDEALDTLADHRKEAFRLKDDEPEYYRYLSELRPGQRAAAAEDGDETFVMAQAGWFKKFYRTRNGAPSECSAEEALSALSNWAEQTSSTDGRKQPDGARIVPQLNEAMRKVSNRFENAAKRFREQRRHPRLTPSEEWVRDKLLDLQESTRNPKEASEITDMVEWIRQGQFKRIFEKSAKKWKSENLPAETIQDEMRWWVREYSRETEELPPPELVTGIVGPDN